MNAKFPKNNTNGEIRGTSLDGFNAREAATAASEVVSKANEQRAAAANKKSEANAKAVELKVKAEEMDRGKEAAEKALADVTDSINNAMLIMLVRPLNNEDVPGFGERRNWDKNIISACCADPFFTAKACICCFCLDTRVSHYSMSGVDKPIGCCSFQFFLNNCCCCSLQGGAQPTACWRTRKMVRYRTHLTNDKCYCWCYDGQCINPACCDTYLSNLFCWGCAIAQTRNELKSHYTTYPPQSSLLDGINREKVAKGLQSVAGWFVGGNKK
jgi:hypothetical protein